MNIKYNIYFFFLCLSFIVVICISFGSVMLLVESFGSSSLSIGDCLFTPFLWLFLVGLIVFFGIGRLLCDTWLFDTLLLSLNGYPHWICYLYNMLVCIFFMSFAYFLPLPFLDGGKIIRRIVEFIFKRPCSERLSVCYWLFAIFLLSLIVVLLNFMLKLLWGFTS